MAYDIPDEIKYREKIIFNLDWKQLGYAVVFGLLSFFSYNLIPLQGEFRFVVPAIIGIAGIGFIFLNLEDKLLGRISFFLNVRKADYNSLQGHKFFGVREVKENLIWLDDGSKIGMFKVQPINFGLLDNARKKTLLANYKAFLNQLTSPIQILVKTVPVDLDDYFEEIKNSRTRRDLVSLYANFKQFEVELMAKNEVKHRNYYVVARYHNGLKMEAISNQLLLTKENLEACGLTCARLEDADLVDFLMSYGGDDLSGGKPETKDEFRDMLTPSVTFYPDHGIVNGEYHRIVKVTGYPRKVEDGWLGAFLCKNEDYDISIHLQPSSIAYTLVYLHNQIIQQTGDLYASTAKGTPNPALEIKRADTMRVYDSLYKGEEKMFSVSAYIDNKAATLQELDLLTEKCNSNLNAQLMVPGLTSWRTADAIKSTLPLANDRLNATREILSGALTATFPFIAAGNPTNRGILFAHEIQTLNPIFIDLDNQTNKHFFIIGVSGSGKSYAAKYFAVQQLFKEQTDLYILDPNGEYSGLCKALHGEVIEISKDSDSILNLFDLGGEDFGGKMLQLVSAFDIIMGGLNESQKALLSDAIINLYAKRGITPTKEETWNRTPPRFSDLKDVLEAMRKEFHQLSPQAKSLDALYRRVKMYCEGNVFGFLDQDTRVNANNGIICFDLSKLPDAINRVAR
ncbi:DUF87 domain-containing protein [Candidatus Micrarchaeota archaeon]|nr:DUF87 domain-containing protein [Candidatus Micrarchaeota archaeon]